MTPTPGKNCTPESAESRQLLMTVKLALDSYVPITMIAVGLVCNTLSILVMIKPKYRSTTTSFYIVTTAVLDNIALATYITESYLPILVTDSWIIKNTIWCLVWNFLNIYAYSVVSFLVVQFCIERCFIAFFPLKTHLITYRRAVYVFIFFALVGLGERIPYLFRTYYEPKLGRCHWGDGLDLASIIMDNVIMMTNYVLGACVLIVNTLTGLRIIYCVRQRRKMSQNTSKTSTNEMRVTITLQMIAWYFTLVNVPWYIMHNHWSSVPDAANEFFCDPEYGYAVIAFSYSATLVLTASNHAVNFFFYFVGFRGFHQDLRSVLGLKTAQKAVNSNATENTTS